MKIIELIELLSSLPNKESEVFIINENNTFASNIGYSIDDNNDIQLFGVEELDRISKTEIDFE